jgi:hypothetical protein
MTITRPFFYVVSMALLGVAGAAIATPAPAQSSASTPTATKQVTSSQTRNAQPHALHMQTAASAGHRQSQPVNRTAKAVKPADDHGYAPHVGRPMDAYQNAVTPPPVIAGR